MKIVVLDSCGDDAECGAGGTMAKAAKAGYEVIIGRISPLNENTVKSAGILGVKEEWLGFPKSPPPHYDDLWDTTENGKKMDAFLRRHGPDIIITHWPVDEHPRHRAVATMTIRCVDAYYKEAIDTEGRFHEDRYCPELYFFEVMTGKQGKCFHPDTYVDVTDVVELKKQAMLLFCGEAGAKCYWYIHQLLMLDFRGRESGSIRQVQVDKGLFAEAFVRFPMPPGRERILLPGMK